MLNYLQNKFALSQQGAKGLLKGSIYSALINLTLMLPVGISILLLSRLLEPLLTDKSNSPVLLKYSLLVILAGGIIYFVHYLQYSCVYLTTYQESANIRIKLAEKLRQLPLAFFGSRDLSDLTNTIMGDCTTIEHAFSHAIPQFLGSLISTLIIIIALLIMNWQLGLSVLWVVPIAFLMIFASKKLQKSSELKHYQQKRICAEKIQEGLENIQDIKSYSLSADYLADLDQKLAAAEQAQIKSELTMGAFVTGSQAILRLGLATVILVGSRLLISNQVDLLTYLIFLITAARLYDPLAANLTNIAEIFNVEIPIQRMQELEKQPVQTGKKDYQLADYEIKVENLTFAYQSEQPVLKDVSFTARQGEVTALIGPSGSGKSTMAKLVARFWDPDQGKILLGGENIAHLDPEALLANYTIVFQDVTLFNDTILENIRLGNSAATNEEVIAAAKIANCDDFISRLPEGYQTIIGENGSTLSGGERQRISIARAFLKDAPVVLLDEATASLDAENETKVQTALAELIKNKTVLVVAHRLRTIESADQIIVLAEGQIVEQGSPTELSQQSGMYSHLLELQKQSQNWSL